MKIAKLPVNADLSAASLLEAVSILNAPQCRHYIIQVHPDEIHWACSVVAELNGAAQFRRTAAPHFSVEMTPVGKQCSWALWAYDDCVWSEGA